MWLLQQLTILSDVCRLPFLQHPSRYRTATEGYTNCFLNFQDTSRETGAPVPKDGPNRVRST